MLNDVSRVLHLDTYLTLPFNAGPTIHRPYKVLLLFVYSYVLAMMYFTGIDDPIPKHIQKAEEGRDALAKYLYCCMFDGIVKYINELLSNRFVLIKLYKPPNHIEALKNL